MNSQFPGEIKNTLLYDLLDCYKKSKEKKKNFYKKSQDSPLNIYRKMEKLPYFVLATTH